MDFRFSSTILYTYALYNSTLLQSSCSTKPSPHALYIPTTKESPTITVSKDCTKSNPFPLLSYRAMEEKFDRYYKFNIPTCELWTYLPGKNFYIDE